MDQNKQPTMEEIMKMLEGEPLTPELRKYFGNLKKKLVLSMMEAAFSQGMTYSQELQRERRDLNSKHVEWLGHQVAVKVKALYELGNSSNNIDHILTM